MRGTIRLDPLRLHPSHLRRRTRPLRVNCLIRYLTNTKVPLPPTHIANLFIYGRGCITDSDGDDITVDGTLKLCEDLQVEPEDVSLLAIAFELKSPRVGE